MSWVDPGQATVMKVDVAATSNGGHPPEFWAKRCVERLVQVSDTAPPAIREQALAFRDQMECYTKRQDNRWSRRDRGRTT
jgi:hypothetical protein